MRKFVRPFINRSKNFKSFPKFPTKMDPNQELTMSPDLSNSPVTPTKRQRHFVGVAGGTASGKTSVCKAIMSLLDTTLKENQNQQLATSPPRVAILYADLFYKNLSDNNLELAKKGKFNFDHPNAIDFELFYKTIQQLNNGDRDAFVKIPIYSYVENRRIGWEDFQNADVIIVEGILVFYDARIRNMFELKIFVDCDADTRLARRVERDIAERGRTIETVLTQYTEFVKPSFEDFCLPTKKHADIIVPRGRENVVAINLITQHIHDLLNGSYQQFHQRSLRLAKKGHAKRTSSGTSTKSQSPLISQITSSTVNEASPKLSSSTSLTNIHINHDIPDITLHQLNDDRKMKKQYGKSQDKSPKYTKIIQ